MKKKRVITSISSGLFDLIPSLPFWSFDHFDASSDKEKGRKE
jgi:hypothetical protein